MTTSLAVLRFNMVLDTGISGTLEVAYLIIDFAVLSAHAWAMCIVGIWLMRSKSKRVYRIVWRLVH